MIWWYLGDVSVILWWCVKMFSACASDVLVIFKGCVGDVLGVSRWCVVIVLWCFGDMWMMPWFCVGDVSALCRWCFGVSVTGGDAAVMFWSWFVMFRWRTLMSIFRFLVGSDAKSMAVPCVFAIGVVCWANCFCCGCFRLKPGQRFAFFWTWGGVGWDDRVPCACTHDRSPARSVCCVHKKKTFLARAHLIGPPQNLCVVCVRW